MGAALYLSPPWAEGEQQGSGLFGFLKLSGPLGGDTSGKAGQRAEMETVQGSWVGQKPLLLISG